MDYAITVYPLSRDYRRRFEAAVGIAPHYLNLGELRRIPLPRLLKTLRGIDGRLFLPLEDSNAKALLPILQLLAVATKAGSIEVIDHKLAALSMSRRRAALVLGSLAKATVAGRYAMTRCGSELHGLLMSPRIAVCPPEAGQIIYLKTNLWLGVKAGGSIGHIAGVVNGLVGQGWGVDFLSAEPPVMLCDSARYRPIQALHAYGLPSEINLYRFHRSFLQQARHVIDGSKPAFIYQRMSIANYVGVELSREYKLPLIIEYNGSEVWISRNWGTPLRFEALAEQAERTCLRHAHLVVTISEVLRDELIDRGVEPERIVVYPNCIDPKIFNPRRFKEQQPQELRAQHGISADALLATFVGTFGQWHGAEVLAEAIRNMAVKDPQWLHAQRLHFLLVGDGLKMPEVRAILEDERCKPFVTFAGLIPQAGTPAYLSASDIFLSPHVANRDGSRFFGSPTKLFEYMAMGKAIIASDLDQIGVVLDGSPHVSSSDSFGRTPTQAQCAMLVHPGDVSQLEAAVRYLAEHPEWRLGLGGNARQRALAKFTWECHVTAILEGLGRVLAPRVA